MKMTTELPEESKSAINHQDANISDECMARFNVLYIVLATVLNDK